MTVSAEQALLSNVGQPAKVARLKWAALRALELDPCSAPGAMRMRGSPPWSQLCRLEIGKSSWRITYGFGPQHDHVIVLAIARHTSKPDSVYAETARLLGVPEEKRLRGEKRLCCADGKGQIFTMSQFEALGASDAPTPKKS